MNLQSLSTSHTRVLGHTRLGLPILAHDFGPQGPSLLLLGGVHGDEIEGVTLMRHLLSSWTNSYKYNFGSWLIPEVNPEGVLLKTRTNSAGIDLNRNLPTKDWTAEVQNPRYTPGPSPNSEPENQILTHVIQTLKPFLIISFHSWKPVILINGDCDQEAQLLSQHCGYEARRDIGYPTPGSLGTYSGIEKNMPTITFEIERGLALDKVVEKFSPAVQTLMDWLEKKRGATIV